MTVPAWGSGTATAPANLIGAWHGQGTTNATGALTVTIPAGTFPTTVVAVSAQAIRDTVAPATACFALVRSYTTTQVVVQVFESKTTSIALGGTVEGLELAAAATPVHVTVWGY